MRVLLDNVVISAGGSESPSDFQLVQARETQLVPRVRADFATAYARGNRRHEIAFTVVKESADIAAATRFILEFPDTVPSQGVLTLEESGPPMIRRFIPNAVPTRIQLVRQIGVTTVWSFAFTGGDIVARDPRRNPIIGGAQ